MKPGSPGYLDYSTECPACDGAGCEHCEDGQIRLRGCPREVVPGWAWEVLGSARDIEHGLLPASGGTADQAAAYMRAARFVNGRVALKQAEKLERARTRR